MISSKQFQPRQKVALLPARSDFDLSINQTTGNPVSLQSDKKPFKFGQCFKSMSTTSEHDNRTKPIVGVRNDFIGHLYD